MGRDIWVRYLADGVRYLADGAESGPQEATSRSDETVAICVKEPNTRICRLGN